MKFLYIENSSLREKLRENWYEMGTCRRHRCFNSCVFLLGRIAEALLAYALERIDRQHQAQTLARYITRAREIGLVTPAQASSLDSLRMWRNCIHLQREIAENYVLDRDIVNVAYTSLVALDQELQKRMGELLPEEVKASIFFAGQEWVMKKRRFVIGRGANNDLTIDDKAISEPHLCLEWQEPRGWWKKSGGFYLRDLQSTNGTYIIEKNHRKKIKANKNYPLQHEAVLYLADVHQITLYLDDAQTHCQR